MAEKKKRPSLSNAWRDARELLWAHRYRLALGLVLMLINRLVGRVLPASSKYLIDEVIIKHRSELLLTLALAAGSATDPCVGLPASFRRCLREWELSDLAKNAA